MRTAEQMRAAWVLREHELDGRRGLAPYHLLNDALHLPPHDFLGSRRYVGHCLPLGELGEPVHGAEEERALTRKRLRRPTVLGDLEPFADNLHERVRRERQSPRLVCAVDGVNYWHPISFRTRVFRLFNTQSSWLVVIPY